MALTTEQKVEFESLARPLIKWLNDNCNPHVTVIIEPNAAQLLTGLVAFSTDDYLCD